MMCVQVETGDALDREPAPKRDDQIIAGQSNLALAMKTERVASVRVNRDDFGLLDAAPQMRLARNRLMQQPRRALKVVFNAWWQGRHGGRKRHGQHVHQMQLGLILLRQQQRVLHRQFGIVREIMRDQDSSQVNLTGRRADEFALVRMNDQHGTGRGSTDSLRR